jgi:hypothetical protein
MKDFLLIYRRDATATAATDASPDQIQAMMKPWEDWMGSLAAQNRLTDRGQRLSPEGNVVKPNKVVTSGPFVEVKEAVGGYSIVKAADLKEASEIAKGCPILLAGGTVEVRTLVGM